jgi:hypothetical protein
LILLALIAGCDPARGARAQGDPRPVEAPGRPASSAFEVARAEAGAPLDPVAVRDDAILLGLRAAVVQQGAVSVGSTSLVLKVPLDGGLTAAFKPETRRHGRRFRAEVAAYRLSRALGLDGVPPSTARAVRAATLLASARNVGTADLVREQAIVRDDLISGAMIAWLPGLRVLPLEREPLRTAWGEWLAITPPRTPPKARSSDAKLAAVRPLAPQIAAMIALDTLTGNRDRWSGFNVHVDQTGTRLVFLDNNLAFDEVEDLAAARRRRATLARVERWPKGLVGKLRALDDAAIETTVGLDHEGQPLLSAAQLSGIRARRDELVTWIDELVGKYGEEKVLSFE